MLRNTADNLFSGLVRLIRDDNGATAIEYALVGALVSIAAIGSMQSIGTALNDVYMNRAVDAFNGR